MDAGPMDAEPERRSNSGLFVKSSSSMTRGARAAARVAAIQPTPEEEDSPSSSDVPHARYAPTRGTKGGMRGPLMSLTRGGSIGRPAAQAWGEERAPSYPQQQLQPDEGLPSQRWCETRPVQSPQRQAPTSINSPTPSMSAPTYRKASSMPRTTGSLALSEGSPSSSPDRRDHAPRRQRHDRGATEAQSFRDSPRSLKQQQQQQLAVTAGTAAELDVISAALAADVASAGAGSGTSKSVSAPLQAIQAMQLIEHKNKLGPEANLMCPRTGMAG